jgi:hypothetical protein
VRQFSVVLFVSFSVLVGACGSSSSAPQAQATAGQGAPTTGQSAAPAPATATPPPTPAPTPQTFDACDLLTRADVATLFGANAQVATQQLSSVSSFNSGGAQSPAANGTSCTYSNIQSVAAGLPTGNQITLQLCRCNSSTADFDVWAKNPAVIGILPAGTAPALLGSVGERAYLLPNAAGILFRQSGVDFLVRSSSRLPDFRQPGATPGRFGEIATLQASELDAKATAVYSDLAVKIIGRLATAPAAPTVIACSAGHPTATPPAGVAFISCFEQSGATSYNWAGSVNGVTINFQLDRRPFSFGVGEGVVVDVNGNPGKQYSRSGAHYVAWSDGHISWMVSAQDTVGPEVALAFARSVRSEIVAETAPPRPTAAPTSNTGQCATVPTVTMPTRFAYASCTEQGSSTSFRWLGAENRGSFTLTIVRPPGSFGPTTGETVDVNGRPGILTQQGSSADVWLIVWSSATLNYSIGASSMSREEVLAAARSVR